MSEFNHKLAHAVPIWKAPASTRKTKTQPAIEGRTVEGAGKWLYYGFSLNARNRQVRLVSGVGWASCAREMPLLNSLGASGDAPATRRLPCRRNLVRNALREVEQFFPREQWVTVVVQGDQTVRVALLGGASTPVPSSSPPALPRRARRSRSRRRAPRRRHAGFQEIIGQDFISFLKVSTASSSCDARSARSLALAMHPATSRRRPRERKVSRLPRRKSPLQQVCQNL